jgi:hypothetical protein
MRIAIGVALVTSAFWPAVAAEPTAQVDHILLGINDLDRGIAAFEQVTGVRPVYGGKHPGGTHNALVSLGDGLYLEILALQPNSKSSGSFAGLDALRTLTPIGWAVSSNDIADLRKRLDAAGMPLSEPSAGSRVTPAGATLSWQSTDLQKKIDQAPFFITWDPKSPHPSTTSPAGCKLQQWRIAGPNHKALEQLRRTLDLSVAVVDAPVPSLRLVLACRKGSVAFDSASHR